MYRVHGAIHARSCGRNGAFQPQPIGILMTNHSSVSLQVKYLYAGIHPNGYGAHLR